MPAPAPLAQVAADRAAAQQKHAARARAIHTALRAGAAITAAATTSGARGGGGGGASSGARDTLLHVSRRRMLP